ncbi:helix-turn-helix domain-containing protein [Streptomyces sp. NPDC005496]|uniref:helix-turn-helix domain-containing protein n=1 Tax=unclassified Streptomyces TaxID=2593676 RepID=UPI0033AD4709
MDTLPPRNDVSMLACWHGTPTPMDRAHRHDDIEINLSTDSELVYLLGGRRMVVPPGELVAFWAAIPHQLIEARPLAPMYWLNVPLRTYLGWRLPSAGVRALLRGQPMRAVPHECHRDDAVLLKRWQLDLSTSDAELHRICQIEIEARLRRLTHGALGGVLGPEEPTGHRSVEHAARMAEFIAAHFREPITVEHIASVVPLHPNYAMSLFKEVLGTTINARITQCRIAESQRLLITTELPISEMISAVGFGSQSSFYSSFTELCGTSPGNYRRAHRSSTPSNEVAGVDPAVARATVERSRPVPGPESI